MVLKFYIINLPRSVQRRNFVTSEMKKNKISNYTFINGFDAINYEMESLQKLVDKVNTRRDLPKGMIGCSVSHVKALREFLCDDKADIGVVLEDDFEITNNLELPIEAIASSILDQGPVLLYAFVKEEMALIRQDDLPGDHGLYAMEKPLNFLSTVGYCVNKNSARNLLSTMFPLKDFPDGWKTYYDFGAFNKLFVIYPFLLRHEVFESDRIENENIAARLKKAVASFIINRRLPILYEFIRKHRSRWRDPDTDKIRFIEHEVI